MKTNHTSLPWSIVKYGPATRYRAYDRSGYDVFTTYGQHGQLENAAFIVRCCNSHDALVDALQDFVWRGEDLAKHGVDSGDLIKARAALAMAKGE